MCGAKFKEVERQPSFCCGLFLVFSLCSFSALTNKRVHGVRAICSREMRFSHPRGVPMSFRPRLWARELHMSAHASSFLRSSALNAGVTHPYIQIYIRRIYIYIRDMVFAAVISRCRKKSAEYFCTVYTKKITKS